MKAYSRTQACVALSSAEAELYSMVSAAAEGLGLQAMAKDFGVDARPRAHVDASTAVGIAHHKGLGRVGRFNDVNRDTLYLLGKKLPAGQLNLGLFLDDVDTNRQLIRHPAGDPFEAKIDGRNAIAR